MTQPATSRFSRTVLRLLWIPHFRYAIGLARYFYYVKIKNALRTINSANAYVLTLPHNLKALKSLWPEFVMDRVDRLLRPLSAIESIGVDSALLVIGPRTESDILLLLAYGFRRTNIQSIDLISYSPWIGLGDMHDIPHPVNSFDAILCGWCLSYSTRPEKVAAEIVRVAKNGALVAIGLDYSILTSDESVREYGYSIVPDGSTTKRINSVQEIIQLFGTAVGSVFFSHDAPMKDHLNILHHRKAYRNAVVMVIFSICKPAV